MFQLEKSEKNASHKRAEKKATNDMSLPPTAHMPIDMLMHRQRHLGNIGMIGASAGNSIQPKLNVSHPNDPYEQEADRIADQVMTMQKPHISRMVDHNKLQRDEEKRDLGSGPDSDVVIDPDEALPDAVAITEPRQEDEEDQTSETIQRKENGKPTAATLNESILNHGGSSLHAEIQADMGGRFGANFNNTRIHTDNKAKTLSQNVGAKAFTYRNHIYFASDQYQPHTAEGQHLLAHELTHTIQQGAVRQSGDSNSPTVEAQSDNLDIQRLIDTSILLQSYSPSAISGAVSGRISGTPREVVQEMENTAIGHFGSSNPVIDMNVVDRWYYYVPLFRTIVGTTRSESTARFGRANLKWFRADDEYNLTFRYQHTATRGPIDGSVRITSGRSRTDSSTISGGATLKTDYLEVSGSASRTESETRSGGVTVTVNRVFEHDYDVTLDYDLKWFNPSDFRATRDFWGPDINQVGGPHRSRGSVSVGTTTVYDDDSNPDNLTP